MRSRSPSEISLSSFFVWGTIPRDIGDGRDYYTLLTAIFLHGGWLHLAGNMLFLWVFGDNIEDTLGHVGFLLFYLLCGLAASAVQVWVDPDSAIPIVGASGAIAGVLGAYLMLFPNGNIRTVFLFYLHPVRGADSRLDPDRPLGTDPVLLRIRRPRASRPGRPPAVWPTSPTSAGSSPGLSWSGCSRMRKPSSGRRAARASTRAFQRIGRTRRRETWAVDRDREGVMHAPLFPVAG